MKLTKFILETLFSPVGLVSIFLVGGLFLSIWRKLRKLANWFFLFGSGLYFLFFCTPLGDLPLRHLERQYPALSEDQLTKGVRLIVVLSAYGVNSPETPITSNLSEETVYRLVEGIRIYRLVPNSKLVVSGGIVKEGDPPIAQLMAEFLVHLGIPETDIFTEETSETTYENLRNVKKFVGDRSFFLVTSAYHLPRTMAVARRLGMNAIPSPAYIKMLQKPPCGTPMLQRFLEMLKEYGIPSGSRVAALQRAFHEYLGYYWYRLRGWA